MAKQMEIPTLSPYDLFQYLKLVNPSYYFSEESLRIFCLLFIFYNLLLLGGFTGAIMLYQLQLIENEIKT